MPNLKLMQDDEWTARWHGVPDSGARHSALTSSEDWQQLCRQAAGLTQEQHIQFLVDMLAEVSLAGRGSYRTLPRNEERTLEPRFRRLIACNELVQTISGFLGRSLDIYPRERFERDSVMEWMAGAAARQANEAMLVPAVRRVLERITRLEGPD